MGLMVLEIGWKSHSRNTKCLNDLLKFIITKKYISFLDLAGAYRIKKTTIKLKNNGILNLSNNMKYLK